MPPTLGEQTRTACGNTLFGDAPAWCIFSHDQDAPATFPLAFDPPEEQRAVSSCAYAALDQPDHGRSGVDQYPRRRSGYRRVQGRPPRPPRFGSPGRLASHPRSAASGRRFGGQRHPRGNPRHAGAPGQRSGRVRAADPDTRRQPDRRRVAGSRGSGTGSRGTAGNRPAGNHKHQRFSTCSRYGCANDAGRHVSDCGRNSSGSGGWLGAGTSGPECPYPRSLQPGLRDDRFRE